MKKSIWALALGASLLGTPGVNTIQEKHLFTEPPNGNSRRTHKQNVRRRKLRRLKNKAKILSKK